MRQARCQLPAGGTITVRAGDRSRSFSAGSVVDLNAIAVPAVGSRPAVTWAQALGRHIGAFAVEETAVQTPAHAAKRTRPAPAPVTEE